MLEIEIDNFMENDNLSCSLLYAYDNGELFPISSGIEFSIKYKIR